MLPLSGYFIMSDMSAVGTAEASGIFGLANGKPAAVGAADQPHHWYQQFLQALTAHNASLDSCIHLHCDVICVCVRTDKPARQSFWAVQF